jgi:hypothetical protein
LIGARWAGCEDGGKGEEGQSVRCGETEETHSNGLRAERRIAGSSERAFRRLASDDDGAERTEMCWAGVAESTLPH